MRTFLKILLLACLLLCMHETISAQVGGFKKGARFSGKMNLGGELYGVDGIENRRAPWSYYINTSMNFGFSGFDVPINFSYRDRQFAFDYSFNRLSIQPRYKWARLLLGTSSISFSPYTLQGRTFQGYGVELTPGRFYLAAIKGDIVNPFAIRDSLVVGNSLIPIFDRKMVGAKVGYRSGKNRLELIGLKVEDDQTSFNLPEDYASFGYQFFTPKENINIGLNFGFQLGRHFDFYANTAASGFTGDVDDPLTTQITNEIPQQINDIITINTSSRYALAGDAGFNFYHSGLRLGLKYKRVEPFYTTMATDYFINDVQQYTFMFSNSFFGRKARLDANVGIENNNLGGYRLSTTDRFIGNASLNIMPTDDFYTVLKYSNYQTEAVNEIINLNDTLRYVSVTNQYGIVTGVNFGDKRLKYGITGNVFFQRIQDQSEIERLGDLNALNITMVGRIEMEDYKLRISPNVFYNKYTSDTRDQERYGIGARVTKRLMDDRLNVDGSIRFSYNDIDKRNDGSVAYLSSRATYKATEKSSFSLMASFRSTSSITRNTFDETRLQLRYGISF